jgi:formate/nitrite transporter FocA (FNT family)
MLNRGSPSVPADAAERDVQSGRETPRATYEVIRRAGLDELERPANSLVWSGVAAGLLLAFSILGEALFRAYLGEVPGRELIENLGYSLGFVLVMLGRMQLFTENTITTVLPLTREPSVRMVGRVARLWSIVLAANLVGTFVAAAFLGFGQGIDREVMEALLAISRAATDHGATEAFLRAIPAGILIAALVWMRPGHEGSVFALIVAFTWLIAAGGFSHIVAGAVEMWLVLFSGDLAPATALFGYFLPVLAGNVVGGTAIFTLLAWGQVTSELSAQK